MPPSKRKPKLSDILIARTSVQGPAQLAVYLAKQVAKKRNPCKHAVVIFMYENEDPDIVWSEVDPQDLDTMRRYFNTVVEDVFREQWYPFLSHPEEDDDEPG